MGVSRARRFLPLAAVLGVQLLIISVAPSKAPSGAEQAALRTGPGGAFAPGEVDEDGNLLAADGLGELDDAGGFDGFDGADGAGGAAGGRAGAPGSGGTGGGDGGGGTAGDGGGGTPPGDTSHCVGDRQFDPAIDFYAPPCAPRFQGDNGGATYQGVTGDTIKIVRYYGQGNAAVDAILQAQGAFVSAAQHQAYGNVAAEFINQHYELYGRKVEIKVVQGRCRTIPPDNGCLRNEMRQLVQNEKPYWVWWNTSLSSEAFDELSRLRTPNAGGWHFRDTYNQLRAPYHWDVQMSGTRLAQHAGRWYCAQLHERNAVYAPDHNPAERLSQLPRRLGVISTNDPENQATVEVDLAQELSRCGAGFGNRKYFYAQDISTADQQRRAAIFRMREDQVGPTADSNRVATTIMCFCDLVAPSFLYAEERQQNYYPENVIVGSGFMDRDPSAQDYTGTVACPAGAARPCAWPGAFGISSINAQEPRFRDAGSRVWRAGGGQGDPPFETVTNEWDYLNMMASLIQAAGPDLTPQAMAAGAPRLGVRGDANHVARGFPPGSFAWNLDMRVVYWSESQASSFNDEPGTYVQVSNGRVGLDGWRRSELQLPPMPR